MTQEIFVGFCFRNVRKITKGVIIDRIISHQPAKPGWCFLIAWFPRNYFYPCQNENPPAFGSGFSIPISKKKLRQGQHCCSLRRPKHGAFLYLCVRSKPKQSAIVCFRTQKRRSIRNTLRKNIQLFTVHLCPLFVEYLSVYKGV